jgi:hypothetical protein
MVLAVAHWLAQGVRNLGRGDHGQPYVWGLGVGRWAYAPIGSRHCTPEESVLWFDRWGGRDGPADWPRLRQIVSPRSHFRARPHARQGRAQHCGWSK